MRNIDVAEIMRSDLGNIAPEGDLKAVDPRAI
jgi:hypothetical protein